jgi:hypothetical protein
MPASNKGDEIMDKILPTIADMPKKEQDIVDYILNDLVQLAREKFAKQLEKFTDTEIRMGLIQLWEQNLLKADFDGEYIRWKLYKPSEDRWIALPTSRAYVERRIE